MGRACSTNGGEENACRILMGKPEWKRLQCRPRLRWVDNIKMDIRKLNGVVWTESMWLKIGTSEGLL
jgi:hypothetical protein